MVKVVRTAVILSILVVAACSSSTRVEPQPQPAVSSSTSTTGAGTAITAEMIGRGKGSTPLSRKATDRTYGYSETNPVKVGGGFGKGSERTYQFLNALRGPNGERVTYARVGTCCTFKTPNSPFGEAPLEVYEIAYEGSNEKRRLYFNWYDDGEALIPVGLSSE